MDVVLVVGQQRGEDGVARIWRSGWKTVLSFDIGNGCIVDLLDGVGGKAFFRTVPGTSALESEFGIVDLVVDIFLETVVSAVHPCNVRVTLLVNTDGGVERIGIVNGHTGVVDNHEVTVGASTGVLSVGAALGGVAWQSGCEARVVVHLGVGVKNGHVDFTRVVGGDVDHGFYEEGHLVGSGAGWELVSLSTSVGVRKCVSWAVSCLG